MIVLLIFLSIVYLVLVPALFLKHSKMITKSFKIKMIIVSIVGLLLGLISLHPIFPTKSYDIFILLETLFVIIICSSIKEHIKDKVSTKRKGSLVPRSDTISSSLFKFSLSAAGVCSIVSLILYPLVIEDNTYDLIVHIKSLYLLFIAGLFYLVGRKVGTKSQNLFGALTMLFTLLIIMQIFKSSLAFDTIGKFFIASIFIISAFFFNAFYPEKADI